MTRHEQSERSEAFLHINILPPVIFAGAAVGLWLRPAGLRGWQVLLVAAVIALMSLLQYLWLWARSSKRWKAALDAFAEREIARDRHS